MNLLITGGSGFFGRHFARAVDHLFDRVIIYSRDEAKQAAMREENDSPNLRFFIGDVRDQQRLSRAMRGVDVVVHAAALKRIETCRMQPDECIKTNVIGTMNVVEAAIQQGVGRVVFLSTDKAFQPCSIYGNSKAAAESLILNANNISGRDGTKFSATRYGNVAGSTGSVIPRWRSMLASGYKKLPVTDPECTRFWMTVDDASLLVTELIQRMKTSAGGELVIPDLPAYRVGDLVTAMGAEMDIKGLPEFEKMHEAMDEKRSSVSARRMDVVELRERLSWLK